MQRPRQQAVTVAAAGAVAVIAAGVTYKVWQARRRQHAEAARNAGKAAAAGSEIQGCCGGSSARGKGVHVRILYGSTTGTSERWARQLAETIEAEQSGSCCSSAGVVVAVENMATFAFDTLLAKTSQYDVEVLVVMLSTHTDGLPPPHCAHFCTLLDDHVHDFRVDKTALSHLNYAVVGFGSLEYEAAGHFCTAAVKVDSMLGALSARRLATPLRVTDTEDVSLQMQPWTSAVMGSLQLLAGGQSPDAVAAQNEDEDSDDESDSGSSTTASNPPPDADDVEELAESCAGTVPAASKKEEKNMLTAKMRAQLTKEGYKIIGSHSAVKLCRWTKHQLRGRGGCYKHSFYGISSYQCMEATPSLACANKCTFCWRHHKNPVGTSWKWRMDGPEAIVAEGVQLHQKMIRECKGIPGVKKERWEEALTVKHCALSLVGEPIMYPEINKLIDELHDRKISTFLVTNAQFPEAIETLKPITQLYVSVDAGTKDALKAVDRPLFADFWERYLASLRALKAKNQRTVYRLTLVKGHNMSDAADYARLVALGEPDFIEIKSVTFCGESKASSLTIANTPWHEEVRTFSETMLAAEGLSENYELACEHQHSCIVLISHKRFKIEGRWHTWIDYDRFNELVASGTEFGSMDYLAPTPEWAVYGAAEAGFDPNETRFVHNRTKRKAKAGLLSDEQLSRYNGGELN